MSTIEKGGYIEAVGRKKTAVARVRIFKNGSKGVSVNDKPVEKYFPTPQLTAKAISPFKVNDTFDDFSVTVQVKGGGVSSQAEAMRHGLTRAFVMHQPEDRKAFKSLGFLKRDSRTKERKKFGLRKARRAPQWSKR